MQHCVITDEPLGQMRKPSLVGGRAGTTQRRDWVYSLIFTDPTSTDSIRARRPTFCDIAAAHISESTIVGGVRTGILWIQTLALCLCPNAPTAQYYYINGLQPFAKRLATFGSGKEWVGGAHL